MTTNGYGYGHGYGSGYGYGYGGYGSGYGDGYGDENGCGLRIATVDNHVVMLLSPWPYVSIGCQTHHVMFWHNNWQRLANEHDVVISNHEAQEIMNECDNLLRH